MSLPSSLNDQIRDQNLHRLPVLIQRGRAHLDQSVIRTRSRRSHLEHFAFQVNLIARPHRVRPLKVVEAGTDNASPPA